MELRGFKSIKIATIKVEDLTVNVAVCNGISAAKEFIESGKYKEFHFVEVMACPGGCVVGGGQPKLKNKKLAEARSKSIYSIDVESRDRISSKNIQLRRLYTTFLGKPGSEFTEELLHTHYEPQETSLLLKRKRMEDMPIVAYGSSSCTSMKWARTVAKFMGKIAIDTSFGDKGEGGFEKWCFKLCSALQLDPPKIGIRLLYTLEKEDDISIIHQPLQPLGFEKGIITSRKRITSEDYCREIYMYSIKLPQVIIRIIIVEVLLKDIFHKKYQLINYLNNILIYMDLQIVQL